ncbi:glycoside hydrolase family 2 protein [Butyrivibrio sp. MB2005]|uniref:glycoside hydrolase family 2 protein n=1 Tax=Butyrivibrio sp. MB2005 TaxID=1280678 RepID=UPI0003F50EDE|nr:glycoside hydrolase family 2 TIM barrel-domain containing protein [Butyrivibrio sp. MB2005]
MRKTLYLNNDWKFSDVFEDKMIAPDYDDNHLESVRIPHSVVTTPFNYFDDAIYQKVSCYRRVFTADSRWKDKRVAVTFMGAAHEATVYINGELLGTHSGGYTDFSFDISDKLKYDQPNCIVVKLDSRESLNVPPFGFVIDYMTYGGLYRDVVLEVTEKTYIEDLFISTDTSDIYAGNATAVEPAAVGAFLHAKTTIAGDTAGCVIKHAIRRISGEKPENYKEEYRDFKELIEIPAGKQVPFDFHTLPVVVWDVTNPALYELRTQILRNEELVDEVVTTFGFRSMKFHADGFYLNGRKLKIRGLNRHQSYPYVGYAMPAALQELDAKILKEELCVNAVRTSHYPQSQDFIDACDRLGILVFMEFPGWQHIGDDAWKEQALVNEKEMITQYRNHPSIFIWGVRINESADDDEFYKKTNELSHELDPSRATGGVRAATKMNLLEDVYTYNDFSFDGKKPGCQKKKAVTPDMNKAYLVTEYNGHMYPTKSFDDEIHRSEHAMRHVKVMDAIAGESDVAGGFGWCMFDYNTHKDFGSGDRICYHGVMDMFRNPKMAALTYAMQGDDTPVLELTSSMDIGEHPECIRGDIWLLTNADSVKMYKNDVFIKEYKKEDSPFKNLAHGPILVDDFIGDQLAQNEKFSKGMAEKVKQALNNAARYGMGGLGLSDMITGGRMLAFHGMSVKDVVDMYQKYIGDWGGKATSFKFEAIKNGKVVKTLVKETVSSIDILCDVSSSELSDDRSYDVAQVRIKAVDQNGNVIPYFGESLRVKTEGAIELIGPKHVPLRGGMAGVYVKTRRRQGSSGKLIIKLDACEKIKKEIVFHVKEGVETNV